MTDKKYKCWLAVVDGQLVQFSDLPHMMAKAMHPCDGDVMDYAAARINLESELPQAVRDGLLRVRNPAGLDGLTLHGLRRSFSSLTEWLETPAGVVAPIQGHKPSATAEKHYKVRPLELLRVHHEKIEAWILEQAGIAFNAAVEPGKLRVVA